MKRLFPSLTLLLFLAACSCNGGKPKDGGGGEKKPDGPRSLSYSIISTFPHDSSSYTQGLIIYKGSMYEGTGNYGESKLRKINMATGKAEKEVALPKEFFGEGVTILNDTIYQLTWKNNKVLVYTLNDLKKVKEFTVDQEGWGLTNDGKSLIATDGSSHLYFYDPSTYKLTRSVDVTEAGSLSYNLNELEYIDGYIYANQYESPYILKIDPSNGAVVAKIDLSKDWDRIQRMRPAINPSDIVPNGIAYDAATKKIYITGKWWPELYEVQFSQ
ncbi:MAG: glutaminyl-peptide cyclotransferase [Chitinophagaceae bacterium]